MHVHCARRRNWNFIAPTVHPSGMFQTRRKSLSKTLSAAGACMVNGYHWAALPRLATESCLGLCAREGGKRLQVGHRYRGRSLLPLLFFLPTKKKDPSPPSSTVPFFLLLRVAASRSGRLPPSLPSSVALLTYIRKERETKGEERVADGRFKKTFFVTCVL